MDDSSKAAVAQVAAAYFANHQVAVAEIGSVISSIAKPFANSGEATAAEVQKPAINVKKSVTPEYIICLEDGKKLKMLRRYLRSRFNLTPEQYRAKWGLAADYPMVAPNYAEQRSRLAKENGLGKPISHGKRR